MSGPRVCLVLESYHPVVGGGERDGRVLAAGLARHGLDVTVLTLANRPGLAPMENLDGAVVRRVAPGAGRWRGLTPVYRELRRLAGRYDLIYVCGFRTFGVPAVLARPDGVPVLLRAIGNGEMSGAFFDGGLGRIGLTHRSLPVRPWNAARRAVLRRADRFVAMAESVAREFQEAGVPEDRIRRIPCCTDLARFRPARSEEREALRRRLGIPADAWVLTFTGRLVSWKGPLDLIAAWKRLRGPGVLLLAGAGGVEQHACESQARELVRREGLESSVRFLGDVPDPERWLRASDAFALPTLNDCFPIALLEAMACGLPCVATTVAGLADVVEDGRNALAVPGRDPDRLALALDRLRTDRDLAARLGARAALTARRYSEERFVQDHLALFREAWPERVVEPVPA